jgi:hypothetical protein
MALFGLFKSKQEREIDDTMREIQEGIFPGGEADFARDIARVSAITNRKIPVDKIRGFVAGCKTLVQISETHDDESFTRSFKVRSGNVLSDAEAFEVYLYFAGEASYFDSITRVTKMNGQTVTPEFKEAMAGMSATYAKGTYKDQIPGGHGEFGHTVTNPIPTISVTGSNKYLTKLRYEGRAVESKRVGSTSSSVTAGNVDIYELSAGGRDVGAIYICPYHKRNCRVAPKGFTLE